MSDERWRVAANSAELIDATTEEIEACVSGRVKAGSHDEPVIRGVCVPCVIKAG